MNDPVVRTRVTAGTIAVFTGILFVVWTIAVKAQLLTNWDIREILAARTLNSPTVFHLTRAVSALAHGDLAIPIALGVAAALVFLGRRRDAGFYAVACLTAWGANIAIKEICRRHRPVGISPKLTDAGWYSYPSGHAMLAVVVFGLGAYMLTRRASRGVRVISLVVAGAFIVLVAFARVFLGAHWPSDTVGAVLAGTAWATGAWELDTRYRTGGYRSVSP